MSYQLFGDELVYIFSDFLFVHFIKKYLQMKHKIWQVSCMMLLKSI